MKFGGEVEHLKGTGTYALDVPAAITLFAPQEVRQLAPSLSGLLLSSFDSAGAVLTLPLKSFLFGIGDLKQPPSFQRGQADHDNLLHFYWQDTWKLHPRLTLNFGLAWSFESNALNHDLTKPQILAPVFSQLQALAQRYKDQQAQLDSFVDRAKGLETEINAVKLAQPEKR